MNEGILWIVVPAAVMVAILFARLTLLREVQSSRKGILVGIVASAAIILLYVVWSLLYYGS